MFKSVLIVFIWFSLTNTWISKSLSLVDPSNIVYGLTTKGHPMLIYEDHTYIKQSKMKNAIAWECSQKRSLKWV